MNSIAILTAMPARIAACLIVPALAVWYQRARRKRSRKPRKKRWGFYPGSIGNAFHTIQAFVQPEVRHLIVAELDDEADDDAGDPDDPQQALLRQLRRIRNGEQVERLRVPLP